MNKQVRDTDLFGTAAGSHTLRWQGGKDTFYSSYDLLLTASSGFYPLRLSCPSRTWPTPTTQQQAAETMISEYESVEQITALTILI